MAYYCRDGGEYRPNADAKHAARVTVKCGRTESADVNVRVC